ncbi:MAG: phosphoenolpyruvate carboxykinase (ATP) [Alicyclobacillaceae bacterium]|nr:phosphoenolpyruvate carboxykinase (ATP) [Alicyclobacillaceae bacterium]
MKTNTLEKDLLRLIQAPGAERQLAVPVLIEAALRGGEAVLSASGALVATTGKYTGRSPKDKFIVKEPGSENHIHWGPVNQPFDRDRFEVLVSRVADYLEKRPRYIFDGFAGADPRYRLPIRVITERAWHNLFARQLFIRPSAEESAGHEPAFTVISAPGFQAVPERDGTRSEAAIIISFEHRLVLICGTEYAGEIKKSIFSVMNYLLPLQGVLSMHCSANVGPAGDVALFFGLSGTGKTTLSADPSRALIGDDEHAWSDDGVFNIEGGCYAKCIGLSREQEPQIWDAIRYGAVLENVVLDPQTRRELYDRDDLTENTRAAYPVDHIANARIPGVAGHPNTVIFLTADAYGVLPPIAKLTRDQAMFHFLSGYTSKLAGTERGVTEPEATFSTCFGAPFLPLRPSVYAEMLGRKIAEHNARVFLVNTGWTGGPYGVGSRMKLAYTRAMVRAALSGALDTVEYTVEPFFGLAVPRSCPDVPAEVLQPRNTWADKAAYDAKARELAARFRENIRKMNGVSAAILAAGPPAD